MSTLVLGAGIAVGDVKVSPSDNGNDIILNIGTNGDRIQIDRALSVPDYAGVRQVQFADGTVWSTQDLLAKATTGTSGNDHLWGTGGANTFDGHGGVDVVHGNGGTDTFIFNVGYGQLEIDELDFNTSNVSTLVLGADIATSDVNVSRSENGNDIILTIGTNGDKIQIDRMLSVPDYAGIRQLQFADGTIWSRAEIQDAATTFTWTGSSTNSVLTGNDFGHNIFEFEAGSELANGGARDNVYRVSSDTGQATIDLPEVAASKNELDFAGTITSSNLWFQQSGDDLEIDLLGTNTNVSIKDWFSNSSNPLQEITASGLKLDSQISQLVQAMATYSQGHAGFDPTSSSNTTAPADTSLQNSIASAWHA